MAGTADALIKEALSHVGYHEGRDKNGNWNNINKFGAWYAAQVKNPAFNGVAWCDEFISYVASVTGNGDIIPLSAYVPSRLNYYRARKLTGNFPPRKGDIGFVLSNGVPVHVFYVVTWDAAKSQVVTCEGNTNNTGSPQGDGVYSLRRADSPTNKNLIYARPAYATTPPPVAKPAASTSRDKFIADAINGARWRIGEAEKDLEAAKAHLANLTKLGPK